MILRILRRTAPNLAVLASLTAAWIGAGFLPEPAMTIVRIPLWGLAFLGFLVLVSRIALEDSPVAPDETSSIFRPAAAAAKPFAPPDPSELARVQVLLRSAGVEPYMVGRAVRVTLDLSIARSVSLEEAVSVIMAALRGDAATLSRSNIVLPAGARGEDALEVLRRRFARELRSRAGAPWHDETPLSSEPAWAPATARPDDGSERFFSSETDGHLDWSDEEPIAVSPVATPAPRPTPPDWGETPEAVAAAQTVIHQPDSAWDNLFSPEEKAPPVESPVAFGQVDPHTGRPIGTSSTPASPPRAPFPGADDLWSLIDTNSEIDRLIGIHLGHLGEPEAGTIASESAPVVPPAPVVTPVVTPVILPTSVSVAPPAPVVTPVPTPIALPNPVSVNLRTEKSALGLRRSIAPPRLTDPFTVLPPIPAGPFSPTAPDQNGPTVRPEDFLDWDEPTAWWPTSGERSEPTLEPETELSDQSIDSASLEDLLTLLDT